MKKRLLGLFTVFFIVLTLIACGTKFNVEFDLNNETSDVIEKQTVKKGGLAKKPNDPLKEGYTFSFWVEKESEEKWVFSEHKVTKNIVLVANWTLNEYTVTFDTKDGAPAPEPQVVIHGETAFEPENPPVLEKNEFLGWYLLEAEEPYDFSLAVNNNLTLEARWALELKVILDFKDDSLPLESQIVLYNQLIPRPDNPNKDGYLFQGWYYLDEGEATLWNFSTPITEDVTLFADWLFIEDHVNVDLNALELTMADGNFILPDRGPVNNVRLLWSSSNPLIVTNKGVVNPPVKLQGNMEVVLTASATYAGSTFEKDFVVTVESRNEPIVTKEKEMDFKNLTNEYEVLDSSIVAYYVDDGNVPYLDIESFLMLLDGLLYSDKLYFTKNDQLIEVSYIITDEDENQDYTFTATIDLHNDTIYVEFFSFFSNYIKSTATDYSEGINYLETYVEEGSSITFDLARYQVDMFVHEIGDDSYYLVPYNFLSMIFLSESYYNFYYNGDGFYGFYAVPIANDEDDLYDTYNTIKTSSLNNTQIPKDVALSSVHQLVFAFDHYFGLRNEERYAIVDSFYEKFETNIDRYLSTTQLFNTTFRSFILKTIDELHSSYSFPGYYNRPSLNYGLFIDDLGPRVVNWYEEGIWEVQDAIDYWHGENRPDYVFLDENNETALIYLDSFLTASVDDEKTKENDSDQFMKETLEAIHAVNPNVKNIGVDLSYNTGGNLGALLRVLGYITEKPIEMSYQDALDGSKITYFVELDTNAYEDVNWFFITSPVTFSAANLMTAIVKNQELGVIIGSTSGGGACSITPFVLADGSMMSISSNSQLSIRIENSDNTYSYYSIENGIEPDIYLAPINTQNFNTILDLVQGYYN